MPPLRVAAVAMKSEFGDVQANLKTILDWLDRAAAQGAQLVCFPEIALQGYCTVARVVRDTAEPIDGSACRQIHARAKSLNITASVGMTLQHEGKLYNSQVFIGPDGFLGAQHKMHLCPADHNYDPGNEWSVINAAGWRIGVTICFDSAFPEAARILALKGADLVLMTFANGRRDRHGGPTEPENYALEIRKWATSRAYDNRVFVIGCNHGGQVADPQGHAVANPDHRPDVEEWAPPGTIHIWPGYNFAVDPHGDIFAESDRTNHDTNMVLADLDRKKFAETRVPIDVKWPDRMTRGDFLAVRRHDSFADLTRPDQRPQEEAP